MEKEELERACNKLHRAILGMNAYGSLDLTDYELLEALIEKLFKLKLLDNE